MAARQDRNGIPAGHNDDGVTPGGRVSSYLSEMASSTASPSR
jgi:hypothetical protein